VEPHFVHEVEIELPVDFVVFFWVHENIEGGELESAGRCADDNARRLGAAAVKKGARGGRVNASKPPLLLASVLDATAV
jgi:hypothetical protein